MFSRESYFTERKLKPFGQEDSPLEMLIYDSLIYV